jgi:hypothetical protein
MQALRILVVVLRTICARHSSDSGPRRQRAGPVAKGTWDRVCSRIESCGPCTAYATCLDLHLSGRDVYSSVYQWPPVGFPATMLHWRTASPVPKMTNIIGCLTRQSTHSGLLPAHTVLASAHRWATHCSSRRTSAKTQGAISGYEGRWVGRDTTSHVVKHPWELQWLDTLCGKSPTICLLVLQALIHSRLSMFLKQSWLCALRSEPKINITQ